MTITKEERVKMRNCAVFLGEPAATELVKVLDALDYAEAKLGASERVLELAKELPVALADALTRAKQAEAERDLLAKELASTVGGCPAGEYNFYARGPTCESCRVSTAINVHECWIAWARREEEKG